jgi:hypothetical protein
MPVTSSNVKSIGYDRKESTLEIEFISGAVYQYSNVPPIVWQEFQRRKRMNESIGKYLNGNIKGTYDFRKVS